jgi:alpha-glucosidase
LVCALNAGRRATALPDGEVLLTSGPLAGGKLPPNTAAWVV